jgi:hypothetical protein
MTMTDRCDSVASRGIESGAKTFPKALDSMFDD